MNPRGKKDRDLSSQCKNRYGNSDKAARKGVRRKKRVTTHRIRREGSHGINQITSVHDPDEVDPRILSHPTLGTNVKWPDTPMSEVLQGKIKERITKLLTKSGEASNIIEAFHESCQSSKKLAPVHIGAWVRYLRAVSSISIVPIPKISADDQRDLHTALAAFVRRSDNESEQGGGADSAALYASP